MLCGRCLMCQVLVLSLPFFLSFSYALQQTKKKRGRQRTVGFLLSGIITKEALIPCIFINRWGCDYVFLHPSFASVFLEREMGNKTAAEPGNQSRALSRQPSNCHLPPPQIASLPPLLPSRYLAGFSESERTADNCLCASCCTCHQPAIETLIIFLIIAKRLVFLPLSSLEEEKKKKKNRLTHAAAKRFGNEVWRRIPKALHTTIWADHKGTSVFSSKTKRSDAPTNQCQRPPQIPRIRARSQKTNMKNMNYGW